MTLQSGDPEPIEQIASRTTVWPGQGPVTEPQPKLRYETEVRIDSGDIVQFLERWRYLSGRVEEYCRSRIAGGQLGDPPPGVMGANDYSLQTTERELWLPSPAYERELIAWAARQRSRDRA